VLEDGKIVEQGHQGKLLQQNGYYAKMYRQTAGTYLSTIVGNFFYRIFSRKIIS
jgi:hypothetical protein